MKKTPRDSVSDALRIAAMALLVVAIVSALSAVMVGEGDSFSPLFTAPAVLIAAVALTLWPAGVVDGPIATAALLMAAVMPVAAALVWVLTGSELPIVLLSLHAVGLLAALIAAVAATSGRRARGFIAALIVLLSAGMCAATGGTEWSVAIVGPVGALVAAVSAALLACVLLAAAVQRSVDRDIPPRAHPAASKVTGG